MSRPFMRLLGSEQSLFTGKVRAYLRYRAFNFEEVLCTRDVYKAEIIPNVGWPVVPVVHVATDDDQESSSWLQDTSVIIDECERRWPDSSRPVIPTQPRQRYASYLLESYADEWLLLPAMHYRWSFPEENEAFLIHEFGMVSAGPAADAATIEAAGRKAYAAFRATVTSGCLGINKDTAPHVEAEYEAFLLDFNAHLASAQYLLGDAPSLGDFGCMAPLYAHLGRDPAPQALMKRIAPRVADYVERMNGYGNSRVAPPTPMTEHPSLLAAADSTSEQALPWNKASSVRTGAWLEEDALPPTLLPIMRRIFASHVPAITASARGLREFLASNPEIDRNDLHAGIGGLARETTSWHETVIGGVKTKAAPRPSLIWMAQRAAAVYLEDEDSAVMDGVVEACDGVEAWGEMLEELKRCRVERVGRGERFSVSIIE